MAVIKLLMLTLSASCAVTMAAVTPATVTDSFGNSADIDSVITWVSFAGKAPYNTYAAYDDGGLAPLFNLARSLINTVLPGDLPYSLIHGLLDGTFDIGKQYSELITQNFMGIAICIVIAIMFMIFFPLVGCCFCCCRTCCNTCGGRKQQDYSEYAGIKRIIFAICLALCAIFIGTGAVCVYVTSGQIPTAVRATDTSARKALEDIDTYLNNTINEMEYLAKDGYRFTKNVIYRDLDNIAELVGVPVRDNMAGAGGVNAAIASMITLDASIANITQAMVAVNNSYNTLSTSSDDLYYAVSAARAHLDVALQNCPAAPPPANCGIDSTLLSPSFNSSNLPDISSEMNMVQSVQGQNLTALALGVKTIFDDIPQTVTNESKAAIDAMKPLLDSVETTIDTAMKSATQMLGSVSLADNSQMITQVTDAYLTYDDYRNYATIGLASLILLMVLFIIIGLLLGVIFSSHKQDPCERGTPSTCGGNCLMASVGFMFIFGFFLMLITMLFFTVGTPLEKYVCVPLKDPTFQVYKELIDGPTGSVIGNGYPLGNLLFQNDTYNLTASGILQGCKDNGAAYSVFGLKNLFDINTLLDYKSTIDINAELAKVNVNLSTIQLMTPDIEAQFNSLDGAMTLNQTSITESLALNLTTNDLVDFATLLNTTADGYSNTSANASAALRTSSAEVMTIQQTNVPQVETDKAALLAAVNNLFAQFPAFQVALNNTRTNLKATENYLHTQGTADINTTITQFANRVLGVADAFAAKALSGIENEVGKCETVWTVYEEITHKILCSYCIDVINGFWISLGWCLFFFIPSVIFSVKLAKHYRCMKYPGKNYPENHGSQMEMQKHNGSMASMTGSNKVKPNDGNAWNENKSPSRLGSAVTPSTGKAMNQTGNASRAGTAMTRVGTAKSRVVTPIGSVVPPPATSVPSPATLNAPDNVYDV